MRPLSRGVKNTRRDWLHLEAMSMNSGHYMSMNSGHYMSMNSGHYMPMNS